MCGPGPDKEGPTYDQQVQADINQQMWDYYQKNYKPLVQKYAATATDSGTLDLEKKKVSGQINADVMKKASPVSSTNAVANQKKMIDLADVKSSAEVSGEDSTKARQIGKQMNVINIGRGQTTKTMAGLNELAAMSVDSAIQDKEREMKTEAVNENAVGSAVGAVAAGALKGYGLYGKGLTVSPKSEYEAELDYYGYGK